MASNRIWSPYLLNILLWFTNFKKQNCEREPSLSNIFTRPKENQGHSITCMACFYTEWKCSLQWSIPDIKTWVNQVVLFNVSCVSKLILLISGKLVSLWTKWHFTDIWHFIEICVFLSYSFPSVQCMTDVAVITPSTVSYGALCILDVSDI